MDRRIAQLGIGRMRHLARRDDFVSQGALRSQREFVFGWLAVDDVLRPARRLGCLICPSTGSLFADHEQQAEVALSGFEQSLYGLDHRCDDALGIARTAPPNMIVVLARNEEGR